ncbi:MAG: hypothetical protein JWP11_3107 [Frankiales bacterium]|nr:hypothetical protein [Frankiales bacterium]
MACAALAVPLPAQAAENSLVVTGSWHRVPADTGGLPMLTADSAAGDGYLLSSKQPTGWDRAQAVSLVSGRPLSKVVDIPPLENRAPILVDEKRHVVIYAGGTAPVAGGSIHAPAAAVLVGIGLRAGVVRVLFRVTTRLQPGERVAGLSFDDSGDDLLVLATHDPNATTTLAPAGSPLIHLDRLSVDGLMRNVSAPRWTSPYQLPAGPCAALVTTNQPAALLVIGSRVYFGCGAPTTLVSRALTTNGGVLPGIMGLSDVTSAAAPSITTTYFPAPGQFAVGETVLDRHTRRLVITSTLNGGQLMRVFDTDHGRYVGTIKTSGNPDGAVSDPRTGRLYFAGGLAAVNQAVLGRADLAPLVPTQGEIQRDPFGGMIASASDPTRLTFDPGTDRLFLPWRDTSHTPAVYSIAVVRDTLPRYTAPPELDPDTGALDTVDAAGLTDSNRSSSAQAFGADYQLVGGVTNLGQNTAGDQGSVYRPGTRSLRQAYVKQASLGSDGSTALAVAAEEDTATDADRSDAGAGGTFVPPALCADFGTSPSRQPVASLTASVTCDFGKEQTHAAARYTGNDAVLMTTKGIDSPVVAPVQVGRSSAEVLSQRLPHRGALRTTVTATAENVSVLGMVTFGKVSATAAVATNGRRGTGLATAPAVQVSGVQINGAPVCGPVCSTAAVADAANKALGGRAYISFPQAQVTRSRGGSTVSVTQDSWYHAERVLDFDKADNDYAVPAMSITVYLDGTAKSRLVVDLAAVSASASYRIYALDKFTGGAPTASGGTGPSLVTAGRTSTLPGGLQPVGSAGSHVLSAPAASADAGLVSGLGRALRLGLRSPAAALPLLFIWALLGLPEYLAARRRLLLELPMLTREQDIA